MDGKYLANEKLNRGCLVMPDPITLVIKGQRPTLLEADKANELIRAINALQNIKIVRGDRDEVVHGDDDVVISYGNSAGTGFTGDVEAMDPHLGTITMTFQDGILITTS